MNELPILTTPVVENASIVEYYGLVTSRNVRAMNIFKDFMTSFRDVFGGRSGSYQDIMDEMESEVLAEIREKAVALGGNAVIGFHLDFESVGSKDRSLVMAHGRGTAVYLQP